MTPANRGITPANRQKKTAHLGGFVGFVLFLGLAGVKKAV
jgi:hypothetical protein